MSGKKISIKLGLIALFGVTLFIVWSIEHSPFPPDITIGQTPGAVPSNIPLGTPQSHPSDLLSWGARLSSKEISQVKGVQWKKYTSAEYGFEMQYPDGWHVETYITENPGYNMRMAGIKKFITIAFSSLQYDLQLSITVVEYPNKGLAEYLKYDEYSTKYSKSNVTINNVNWTIDDIDLLSHTTPNSGSTIYTAQNGYIYKLTNAQNSSRNEGNIIEYMIKSFHFTK